ncbi:MAG: GIY-YIG nuclease family protein [Rhodothermales bacterium]|nr:GIY-YIG nuclease family protein [Rhodothermales bacterium]
MARRYHVYVIELDPEAGQIARFRRANPDMASGAECFYVGSSVREPVLRFDQHKEGYKSNRFAREYGMRLRPDLFEQYNPIPTRKDAEELEVYLAERLRARGYGVWQG